MLNKKLTFVATLIATLTAGSVMAEQKADKKFVDDSSYAVGVLMGKNIEGIVESQKEVFTYNQDKILAGVQDTLKKTDSGLLYKIEKAGEGASPSKTDVVKVHYKGTLPDGTVFDSSYDRNAPVEFQLDQLIPAWVEAIPMLKKGGKMEIVVPPALGYGDRSAGKIPANSTLKFEIELLDFKPAK